MKKIKIIIASVIVICVFFAGTKLPGHAIFWLNGYKWVMISGDENSTDTALIIQQDKKLIAKGAVTFPSIPGSGDLVGINAQGELSKVTGSGGGGTAGDVFLANNNVFTGANQFINDNSLIVKRATNDNVDQGIYFQGADNINYFKITGNRSTGKMLIGGTSAGGYYPIFTANNVEVGEFSANGIFKVHNWAGTGVRVVVANPDGTSTTQVLPNSSTSGTYVPTITSLTSLTTVNASAAWYFTRVGDVWHVHGEVTMVGPVTVFPALASFEATLPAGVTSLGSSSVAAGVGVCDESNDPLRVKGVVSQARVKFSCPNSINTTKTYSFNFSVYATSL